MRGAGAILQLVLLPSQGVTCVSRVAAPPAHSSGEGGYYISVSCSCRLSANPTRVRDLDETTSPSTLSLLLSSFTSNLPTVVPLVAVFLTFSRLLFI